MNKKSVVKYTNPANHRRQFVTLLIGLLGAFFAAAGSAATISSVSGPASGTYVAGDTLDFIVTYSGDVALENRSASFTCNAAEAPMLVLGLDSGHAYATMSAVSFAAGETDTHTFNLTVDGRHFGGGNVEVLGFEYGACRFLDATTDQAADLEVSAVADIGGIVIRHSNVNTIPDTARSYVEGEELVFTTRWPGARNLSMTGSPTLELDVGGSSVILDGELDGDDGIDFVYTVQAGDTDGDGISIVSLSDNGASITADSRNDADTDSTSHTLYLNNTVFDSVATIYIGDGHGPVLLSVTPPNDGVYSSADILYFSLNFDQNVTAISTANTKLVLRLEDGSLREASYLSGDGTSVFQFFYFVPSTDPSSSGIELVGLSDSAFLIGGGVFPVFNNNILDRYAEYSGITITGSPTISGISVPDAVAHETDDLLQFSLTFSETVNVEGTPLLSLDIGGETVTANYVGGTGSNTLEFEYRVGAGLQDNDGIEVLSLDLNNGSIKDSDGNGVDVESLLAGDTSEVDVVLGGRITSIDLPVSDTYAQGDTLDIGLNFDRTVNVVGAPELKIQIGDATLPAVLSNGSGTSTLQFSYSVSSFDSDIDGIEILALELNGATIRDDEQRAVDTTLSGLGSTAGILVDGGAPDGYSLSVDQSEIDSSNETTTSVTFANAEVGADYQLQVFTLDRDSQTVLVNGEVTQSNQQITSIDVSSLGDGELVYVLRLLDSAGNAGQYVRDSVLKQSTQASIASVTVPSNGSYGEGMPFTFTVNFDRAVVVTGAPTLEIQIGTNARQAELDTLQSTDSSLVFVYTLGTVDEDNDGVTLNAINLNGGGIDNVIGDAADLTLAGLPDLSSVTVEMGDRDFFTGIVMDSSSDTHLSTGEILYIDTVDSNGSAVFPAVTGAPQIQVQLDSGVVTMDYEEVGILTRRFKYTIQATDFHNPDNPITLVDFDLNGGTYANLSNEPFLDSLEYALTSITGVTVNDPVSVAAIDAPAGFYQTGDTISFTVEFYDDVTVAGIPQLSVDIGPNTRVINLSNDVGNTLTFDYVVQASDDDVVGVIIDSLSDGGGSITVGGNNADLSFNAGFFRGVIIDRVAPLDAGIDLIGAYVTDDNSERMRLAFANAEIGSDYDIDISSDGGGLLNLTGTVSASNQTLSGIDLSALSDGNLSVDATLTDSSNNSSGTFSDTAIKDTVAPSVVSASGPSANVYGIGSRLQIRVIFDEPVYPESDATLLMTVGDDVKTASLTGGSGTTTLVYSYTVTSGDEDTNGIAVQNDGLSQNLTDAAGNSGVYTIPGVPGLNGVKVDTERPVVTPPDDITVIATSEQGIPVTDPQIVAFLNGATAVDNLDGVIDPATITNNVFGSFISGTKRVTFRAVDSSGNEGPAFAYITVVDSDPPVISLIGDAIIDTPFGESYVDPGVIAIDGGDGDISDQVVASGEVDVFTLGTYQINFNVSDSTGRAAETVSRTVRVVDTVPPTIDAGGDFTVGADSAIGVLRSNVDLQAYLNAATATDNADGELVVSNDVPETLPIGSNTVTFSAVDSSGNGSSVTTQVIVADLAAPVISLLGDSTITLPVGTAFVDPGFNATDNVDGDLGASVLASGTVDINTPGTYTINYNVSDAAGNAAMTVTRTVIVSDNDPPILTVPAAISVEAETAAGTAATQSAIAAFLAAANASDAVDAEVSISNNAPAVFPLGATEVQFTATDASGNAVSASSSVTVVDTTAPAINLPADITVDADSAAGTAASADAIAAFLAAATSTDLVDGALVPGNNAPAVFPIGTTVVEFSVSDAAGNSAQASASVTVSDLSAPVITLNGEADISLGIGAVFSDPGAAAQDTVDGDLSAAIAVSGSVNTAVAGVYTLSYNVSDTAGNAAETRTRTVTVSDNQAPVLSVPAATTLAAENAQGTAASAAEVVAFLDAATATDDAASDILISNNAPAVLPLGSTVVTFTATDASGNSASADSTITVSDLTPPVISLIGEASIDVPAREGFSDPGASALDNVDGDISAAIQVSGTVDTTVLGTYTLSYSVSDAANNSAEPLTRTVNVVDVVAPVVTPPASITVAVFDDSGLAASDASLSGFLDGASAVDDIDGFIELIGNDAPAVFDVGTTVVEFSATDSSGNTGSASATVTVEIADSDDDGIPDFVEVALGLDPANPADALGDLDGDGISNLQEYLDGSDPNLDEIAPVLTVPAAVTVISTGALTPADIGQATATDNKDIEVLAIADQVGPFPPGPNTVTWTATDAAGNSVSDTQMVNVIPMLNFGPSQTADEGSAVTVELLLNGEAISYPVIIPFTVGGSSSSPDDHDLADATVTIESGRSVSFTVNLVDDAVAEGTETIDITMAGLINAVPGAVNTHTIRIVETNVAPSLQLSFSQDGEVVSTAYADAGEVTVTVDVDDPNAGDSHSFDWGNSDNQLAPLNGFDQQQFVFDPAGLLDGVYQVVVIVTDDGEPVQQSQLDDLLAIQATRPVLADDVDSDGDGISDADEGTADSDGDKIPDYLDDNDEPNQLPAGDDGAVVQADPGLSLSLGETAFASGGTDATVSLEDLEAFGGSGGGIGSNVDDKDFVYPTDLFDFELSGMDTGVSASLVIPLSEPIPAAAVYRKFFADTGWQDFVIDADNSVASAPGADGSCPAPGSVEYVSGLTEGDHCIELTILDGGPNDTDGVANGVVKDPGGIAVSLEDLDSCVAYDLDANQALVQDAYIAYYGRPAEPAGLNFWTGRLLEAGGSLDGIIEAFGLSDEYERRFAGLDDAAFVEQMFLQLFERVPDEAGLQFYVDWLQQGVRTRQTMALDILFGAEGDDVEVLGQKRRVAEAYLASVETQGTNLDESELAQLLVGVESLASANGACLALQ